MFKRMAIARLWCSTIPCKSQEIYLDQAAQFMVEWYLAERLG